MSDYGEKSALIDLGFISGYIHANWDGEDEQILDALDRIEAIVVGGSLDESEGEHQKRLLYDLGDVRGRLWNKPLADAVPLALDRVIRYYGGADAATWRDSPVPYKSEAASGMLSDQDRDWVTAAAVGCAPDITAVELAECVDRPVAAVESLLCMAGIEVGGVDDAHVPAIAAEPRPVPPAKPKKAMGAREWTPEQRAAAAERARNRPPLVPDSDFDAIKAKWEEGLSFDMIARPYPCSGSYIRNFLMKHGIDPRRSKLGADESPITKEDKPVVVAQVKGATSHGIGKMLDVEKPFVEAPPDKLIEKHTGYAGRRDPDQELTEADWPDIRIMLEKQRRSVGNIASDYDVPYDVMRDFINRHVWSGNPAPGEARAPYQSMVRGAN